MKIKPVVPNRYLVPTAISGLVIRDTKHGLVAQKRPEKGKRKWTNAERAWQTRFGIAARFAAAPFALDMMTAIEMAKGTEQVPRDILTMAALGRYYEIVLEDGTVMSHVPGAIANTIEPTEEAMWNWSNNIAPWNGTSSGSAHAFKGCRFDPEIDFAIQSVRAIFTAVSGASYRAAFCQLNGSLGITSVALSDPVVASSSAKILMEFPLLADAIAGNRYAVMIGRTDSTTTYVFPLEFSSGSRWLFPHSNYNFVYLDTLEPLVGDTLTDLGTGGVSIGLQDI